MEWPDENGYSWEDWTSWKSNPDVGFAKVAKLSRLYCNPSSNVEVHSLTCSHQTHEYILAVKSFLRFVSDVAIVVHDDGSLTEDDKKLIKDHIGGIRIVDKSIADSLVNPQLKNRPASLEYRKAFVNSIQLFDFSLLSQGERVISLDSDILVLNEPTEIINWIKDPNAVIKCTHETKPHESNRAETNIGMCAYSKKIMDLDSLEGLLSKRELSSPLDWFTGQNILSDLLINSKWSFDFFGRDKYQNPFSFQDNDPELRHYFTSTWVFGWESTHYEDTQKVLKELEEDWLLLHGGHVRGNNGYIVKPPAREP